jgi:UDP-N-acetylglucosamine 2-epimerase (non-hydrolysing)
MKKKILIVYGTRPEAIKLAPIILKLKVEPNIDLIVCVTAQHRNMLDQVNDFFEIKPDLDLNLMQENQTLSSLTGRVTMAMTEVIEKVKPDLVMVQGDTTTVFGTALASFYCKVPIAHVEAGLRTGDLHAPWPEEGNRLLTTRLSNLHFAPTQWSADNLLKEGVAENSIFITGNSVIDALFFALKKESIIKRTLEGPLQDVIDLPPNNRVVLITGHRRENYGQGFENICKAIKILANKYPDVHFVYPVHLNPAVQTVVNEILGQDIQKNVHLLKPLIYNDFILLMNRSYIILTDSGGIQEEAPSLGKPVLVMRDKTERPEAFASGISKLVGTNIEKIVSEVGNLLDNIDVYNEISNKSNPFGDGKAADKIIEICKEYLTIK